MNLTTDGIDFTEDVDAVSIDVTGIAEDGDGEMYMLNMNMAIDSLSSHIPPDDLKELMLLCSLCESVDVTISPL